MSYFTYTTPSGQQHTARNPFHDLYGRVTDPNGRPIDNSVWTWDQQSLSRQVQLGAPTSWEQLRSAWPPSSAWDAFRVGHNANARCLRCHAKSQQCNCDPRQFLQTFGDWRENFFLYDGGDGRGPGVYARKDIARDEVLGIYAGKLQFGIIAHPDGGGAAETSGNYDNMLWHGNYDIDSLNRGDNDDDLRINAEQEGNWTRFINHSCSYNCEYARVRVGKHELMVVRTVSAIPANAEVAVDYGEDYFWFMRCLCGAPNCLENDRDGPETMEALEGGEFDYRHRDLGSARIPGHTQRQGQQGRHSDATSGQGSGRHSRRDRGATSGQSSGHGSGYYSGHTSGGGHGYYEGRHRR